VSHASRLKRCWFCGERHVRPGDPPEHIIPAALGAELTTNAVAGSCNERAGREIDHPLVSDLFVGFNRVFYDIRDRRGSPPPNLAHRAKLKDGTPVAVDMREKPWRMTILPKVKEEGEDRFTLTVSSMEEAEEIIEKKRKRTGQNWRVEKERRYKDEHPEVLITVSLDTRIRVRARAKMTLGTLSKVLPEEWLDSPEAQQLQEWLWDPRPKRDGKEIGAMHSAADGALGVLCQPPYHLVALMPMGVDRLMVMVILFGKEVMPYEVQLPAGIAAPETCWVMDPRKRKVREVGYMELINEIGASSGHEGDEHGGIF
jgi:hypothetical protein